MPVELVGATSVAGRATAQVRRALANREVETLDERGVQGLGILRLPQRSLQPTRRADPPAPFDSDDAIVPPSLEHLTIDARRPKEALTHPNVVLEPIGRDQRESHHASAEDGVSMGKDRHFRPRPLPQNPKGFFENIQFRRVNDQLLEASGYRVKSWNPTIPDVTPSAFHRWRMRRLLTRYDRRCGDWGWKDPRTGLTLEPWLDELRDLNLLTRVRVVYIFRTPLSVANSMVRRGNTDLESAIALWTTYNHVALQAVDQHRTPCVYTSFEDLCRSPERTAQRIFGFLGRNYDRERLPELIDPQLDRSSTPDTELTPSSQPRDQTARLEAELRHRCTSSVETA